MIPTFPTKVDIVGTGISTTSYEEVLALLDRRPRDRATVVTVCNVHSVMTARRDPAVAAALERSDLATPDGVPLVWMLRRMANPDQSRVYGPEIMRRALQAGQERGWRHYFYGSSPETLARLAAEARVLAPEAQIVGMESPPYRDPTAAETAESLRKIRASGADLVWVGLGMPKQELWMDSVCVELGGVALLGVGAAFDFLARTKPQAPVWMQRGGLEWVFRLATEPRRLWRRYLWNNPGFVALAARQLIRGKLT